MVRIFNAACKEWWLPGYGSGMTKNIEEAWVLPLDQAKSLTPGATVLIFEPVRPTPTTPDELTTARASEARLRGALESVRDNTGDDYFDPAWVLIPRHLLDEATAALSGSSGEWLERHDAEAVAAERERAEKAEATWRCFHCGFKTDDAKVAEAHFGDVDEEEPICRSWERMNADEKVGAFQGALQEIASEQEENSQLRSKLEKAEAERDGLVARLSEAIDWLAALRRNHPFGKENSQWAFDTAEWASDDIGDQAPALARITAEARRKALLEAYERVKNLRGCNAYDVIDSIEEMAKESDHG